MRRGTCAWDMGHARKCMPRMSGPTPVDERLTWSCPAPDAPGMSASSLERPVLYCFSGSPFVWRAEIALCEKGIGYDRRVFRRKRGEHRIDEVRAVNPRMQLPILLWGKVALYESMAICHFLELEHPAPPLIPVATADRARALVLSQESHDLDSGCWDAFMIAEGDAKLGDDSEPRWQAHRKMHGEVQRWEAHAAAGGDYLVGDTFTLADIAAFPTIAFCVRYGLDLAHRAPRLAAWYARMASRPSVDASWPDHWRARPGKDAGFNEPDWQ